VADTEHEAPHEDRLTIWTVGHSTRSVEEFERILTDHQITNLVDVRSFPGSRRYPQFNKEQLSASLATIEIRYHHLPILGGRRRTRPDSKNTAWKNASFRGYADYMETKEFAKGIQELLSLADENATAIMCAEALWWRCHRSLIADYLKAAGVNVVHLVSESKTEPHPYTAAARIIDGRLSYEGLLAS
jgi:uncharacterized protein (DUF488 family)